MIAAYLVVRDPESRVASLSRFVAGLVPGVMLLAWLQRAMYGSPLATGYGDVDGLMAVGHVLPNLRTLPAVADWRAYAISAAGVCRAGARATSSAGVARVSRWPPRPWLCYLPYRVFDDWWYTRFLLPAIPLLIILSASTLVATASRLEPAERNRGDGGLRDRPDGAVDSDRAAPGMRSIWRRWSSTTIGPAPPSRRSVTGTAAIVTLKDSGSVQYHTGRPTLSWDTLEPASLDQALAFVRARGYTPYLLLEIDEEPVFRDRFRGASVIGNLDWPPRVQVGRTIRLYEPLDRAPFLKDGQVRTEFVRDTPLPSRDWRRWVGPSADGGWSRSADLSARRPSRIFMNDRLCSSSSVSPLIETASSSINRAAVQRSKKVVQQSLSRRCIVEHVADERRLRRLLDEVAQAIRRRGEPFEKETIDRGIS